MTQNTLIITISLGALTVIELIGQYMLVEFFYKFGIPFKRISVTGNPYMDYKIDAVVKKTEGKY